MIPQCLLHLVVLCRFLFCCTRITVSEPTVEVSRPGVESVASAGLLNSRAAVTFKPSSPLPTAHCSLVCSTVEHKTTKTRPSGACACARRMATPDRRGLDTASRRSWAHAGGAVARAGATSGRADAASGGRTTRERNAPRRRGTGRAAAARQAIRHFRRHAAASAAPSRSVRLGVAVCDQHRSV